MNDEKYVPNIKWIVEKLVFYKDGTIKDGLRTFCNFCTNQYHYNSRDKRNLRERNRRKKDFAFKLANIIR